MNRWKPLLTIGSLSLIWALLAAGQWREYAQQRQLTRELLRRQAHSVMDALGGGIRSHRRLGFFFANQLESVLEALVQSPDIVAVALVTQDGQMVMSAGAIDLLRLDPPLSFGEEWLPTGFRLTDSFELDTELPSLGQGSGFGQGLGPGLGQGLGPGLGQGPPGQGGRRGRGWREQDDDPRARLPAGGKFVAVLLLDRSNTDRLCRRSAWMHALIAAGGGLVIFCVALAWQATVRLAEARGQTRVLKAESRHLRDLGQAAAGLAHETRNPLGVIRGFTQQLTQSGQLADPQLRKAQAVVEECDRVTAQINQFLTFARPREPKLAAVDPDVVIDELALLLEPDLEPKRLRIHHTVAAPPVTLQADRDMLRQALFNLVQNAVAFSPEGETIDLAVRKGEDGSVCIQVGDRGPGVAEDAVGSLFTPYFTTRAEGTGLGLAIVRRIAKAHGWQVDYRPRDGGGAWFEIEGSK
jgi:signal transduction histidine kinase